LDRGGAVAEGVEAVALGEAGEVDQDVEVVSGDLLGEGDGAETGGLAEAAGGDGVAKGLGGGIGA